MKAVIAPVLILVDKMPGRPRVVKGPTIWKKRECLFYGRGENEWEGRDAHASAERFW